MGIDVRDTPDPANVVAVTVPLTWSAVVGLATPIPTYPVADLTTSWGDKEVRSAALVPKYAVYPELFAVLFG